MVFALFWVQFPDDFKEGGCHPWVRIESLKLGTVFSLTIAISWYVDRPLSSVCSRLGFPVVACGRAVLGLPRRGDRPGATPPPINHPNCPRPDHSDQV
jgi:hypothetical protein